MKYIFILTFLLCSCGPADREFTNPHDPNREEVDSNEESEPEESGTENKTTDSGINSPAETEVENKAEVCLHACDTPQEASFNFANTVELTPEGCEDVRGVRILDNGDGLMVFINVKCSQRHHVYAAPLTYEGNARSTLVQISSACDTSDGVVGFEADRGNTSHLVVYTCKRASNDYDIHVVSVDFEGGGSAATTFLDGEFYLPSYKVLWNLSSGTFGVYGVNKFQRFDESANKVGGPITIGDGPIYSDQIINGSWVFTHYDSFFSDGGNCTKVNGSGILECNRVNSELDLKTMIILSHNHGVTVAGVGGGLEKAISPFDFNVENCQGSNDGFETRIYLNNKIASPDDILRTLYIGNARSLMLFKTAEDSLGLATFSLQQDFTIQSEVSVTGFSNLNSADMRVINNKIYVAYDNDGRGFMTYTKENID